MQSVNESKLNRLIEGCCRHDRTSQKEVYQLFYNFALVIALRYVATTDEAREVVNESFLKVFNKIESFRVELSFKSWVGKIVVHTAIDHYRKYTRQQVATDELEQAAQTGTDAHLLEQISADELLKMVQQLPPAYRMAINLYAIEGYDHGEIAALLGISEGTSKSNLFKARVKLRKMMEKVQYVNRQE